MFLCGQENPYSLIRHCLRFYRHIILKIMAFQWMRTNGQMGRTNLWLI